MSEPQAKIEVVGPEEMERADYVVCVLAAPGEVPPVPNLYQTICCGCFRPVWVSSSSPMTPPKICIECAAQMVQRQ